MKCLSLVVALCILPVACLLQITCYSQQKNMLLCFFSCYICFSSGDFPAQNDRYFLYNFLKNRKEKQYKQYLLFEGFLAIQRHGKPKTLSNTLFTILSCLQGIPPKFPVLIRLRQNEAKAGCTFFANLYQNICPLINGLNPI